MLVSLLRFNFLIIIIDNVVVIRDFLGSAEDVVVSSKKIIYRGSKGCFHRKIKIPVQLGLPTSYNFSLSITVEVQ